MDKKRTFTKVHAAVIALSIAVIGLLAVLIFAFMGNKNGNEPQLSAKDFSATDAVNSSSSQTTSSLGLADFDLANKTFTGNFGKLNLKNITKISEIHDDDNNDKDQYLKIDFALTNTTSNDLSVANVIHGLVLQQNDGMFEKPERLEQLDADDYHDFNLSYEETALSADVKTNATTEGFVIYDLENNSKPVQFLLTNGEKAFEFE
jgi:hypothetical protein